MARRDGPLLDDRLAVGVLEAATLLGVSERHLRSILHEIPHTHIGRRVVIPVDGLRQWLHDRVAREVAEVDRIVAETLKTFRR